MDGNVHSRSRLSKTNLSNRLWFTILNQIYEEDFLGFSYGSPGRNQHQALDALSYRALEEEVELSFWMPISEDFSIPRQELADPVLEHAFADRAVLRLIRKMAQRWGDRGRRMVEHEDG